MMVKNKALIMFFRTISLFGTPYFYTPMIVYFLKINSKLAINLAFVLVLTEIVCAAFKYVYPKKRPVPMPNRTFIQKYFAGSFPSVHTSRITAFSVPIVGFYTSSISIFIALLLIIGVSYSRIYLKKHYFTDVLAGFMLGGIISIAGLTAQDSILYYLKLLNMPFS